MMMISHSLLVSTAHKALVVFGCFQFIQGFGTTTGRVALRRLSMRSTATLPPTFNIPL